MIRRAHWMPAAWLVAVLAATGALAQESTASREELAARRQALREDVAFDKARLSLSKGKAFYLVLNAPARTLTLELNGVTLRTCAIERIEMDRRMVKRRKDAAFPDSLATPFQLLGRAGTIPETPPPVDVDTTQSKEAEQARKRAKFSDADLTLTFDRDLLVHITTQGDSLEASGALKTRLLNRGRLLRLMVRSWLHGGPFKQQGEVFLQIGRTDARALYWALPDSSGLALRF